MEPRWVLQIVGELERSAVAWAVRYYADGATDAYLELCRRRRAYLELQMVGGVEESAVAWPVR